MTFPPKTFLVESMRKADRSSDRQWQCLPASIQKAFRAPLQFVTAIRVADSQDEKHDGHDEKPKILHHDPPIIA
jgi:hypothetical protein